MATQDDETSNGWPLGIEIMNMRLSSNGGGHTGCSGSVKMSRSRSKQSVESVTCDGETNQSLLAYKRKKNKLTFIHM
ncbi:hypothetical protein Dsin_021143 [Dipteronia sinensis]|uniref:Uncharacterized protein n=1 Tax=Dipteronia sinensis TaxID=43782 RepID=A0AAE0AB31_9ROSI|nr:hypothetical protein Dsin_021143 [Dipteronia sinensis]